MDDDLRTSLRRVLSTRDDVRLAILFGSAARGTLRPDSDLDIAVLAPDEARSSLAAAISRATGREVDVVSLTDPGVPLLEEILRDGVVLHESAPGAAATWRAHALTTLETDRPGFVRMRDAFLARLADMTR